MKFPIFFYYHRVMTRYICLIYNRESNLPVLLKAQNHHLSFLAGSYCW